MSRRNVAKSGPLYLILTIEVYFVAKGDTPNLEDRAFEGLH